MELLNTPWVPGTISPGVQWPGRETDHFPPSSAASLSEYVFMAWCLIKQKICLHVLVVI
jgi:hypothetical protein